MDSVHVDPRVGFDLVSGPWSSVDQPENIPWNVPRFFLFLDFLNFQKFLNFLEIHIFFWEHQKNTRSITLGS